MRSSRPSGPTVRARDSGDSVAPEPGPDPTDPPRDPEALPQLRRSRSAGVATALGAAMVAVDEQIMRRLPRAEVLVQRGSQLRGERAGGGDLIVDMPEPLVRPSREEPPTDPR